MLLVLAYTHMLIQQMDNSLNLSRLETELDEWPLSLGAGDSSDESTLANWFKCVLSSVKTCTLSETAETLKVTRFERLWEAGREFAESVAASSWRLLGSLRLEDWPAIISAVWLSRLSSPIVQRLVQSIAVQCCYLVCLALPSAGSESESHSDYDY